MANITLLISEAYLKEGTILNENVDIKNILPNIKLAQDEYIKPALGSDLYDEILDEMANSNLSAANDTLLTDFIKPCLKYYCLFEIGRDLTFKWMNKGVMSKNSDNSNSIDLEGLKQIRAEYKDKGELYRDELIRYLIANQTDYPSYTGNTTLDKTKPIGSGFSSPVYLKKSTNFYCEGRSPQN